MEEKLKLVIDDTLPRILKKHHFTDNDFYSCIRFAEHHKKADQHYKHFSSVAFLICKSYPGIYQPFQFSHSKTNQFFRGSRGKKNFLDAVKWVIENKLCMVSEDLKTRKDSYLNSRELQYYGLGLYWYTQYFCSIKELNEEIVKFYTGQATSSPTITTKRLREILTQDDVNVNKCYIEGCSCSDEIQIHHMIPRKFAHMIKLDIHSPKNLIPLCPDHHEKAKLFDWKKLLKIDPNDWRKVLSDFLKDNTN